VCFFATRHQRLYSLALEERDHLLGAFPDSIASFYAAARLDISLGRNETAIGILARAEERARTLRDVDPVVLRCIDLLHARAELASFRPDRALAIAERALAASQGLGSETRAEFEAIRMTAARQAEGIAWSQLESLRAPSDEAAVYSAMATAHPERPLLALLAGDAELRAGRAQEALDWCTRAVAAGLPPELQAGCQLRQGQAEDLLSQRSRALEIYKRVAATSGFVARDAAVYYQQTPYRPAR
jgi:hypothetical protein